MILYFDNYITDEPMAKGNFYHGLEEVRAGCRLYRSRNRLEVAMYTLASYAVLDWSNVIIKYEIQDTSKKEQFESFVKKLFPKAIIIYGRSDNQKKFRESLELMKKLGDEWIFYAGNTDHPFVAEETETLRACLKKARELKARHKFVSISYSHFLETRSIVDPDSYRFDKRLKVIDDSEKCTAVFYPDGQSALFVDSIIIMHIDMFEHIFCSVDLGNKRIIRSESLIGSLQPPEHVAVLPKNEICRHFDGYSHIQFHVPSDPNDLLPPLFIPDGFFEGKIRVAFGYDEYREGWVNMNPLKEKYSFRDSVNGTDLKSIPQALPLFWKDRIAEIDINKNADMAKIAAAYEKDLSRRAAPWVCKGAYSRLKMLASTYRWGFNYYKNNPEELFYLRNSGRLFLRLRKNMLYAAIMAGYKIGLFKKSQRPTWRT